MRVFNFSAGPAALPEAVLTQAAAEMLDWRGSGMSVMEMSHRGKEFMSIADQAMSDLRELLAVPADYETLFVQGGGLAQNALLPLNLLGDKTHIDFVVTGAWSAKSAKEAARYCSANVIADGSTVAGNEGKYRSIPDFADWRLSKDAAYLHLCTNETIDGVEYQWAPSLAGTIAEGTPIVADMSSHLLSRVMNVSDYDCIFGGAQKNIGPAGLTLMIIRKDLLGRAHKFTPSAFDFKVIADNGSMYNTPPTYAIYIAGLVFDWLKKQGGVAAVESKNIAKAQLLYSAIDSSQLYENRVKKSDRSRMNVSFFLRNETLNDSFVKEAKEAGLVQIKGHRAVGGMRASIYNAMPIEGVRALVNFMADFEHKYFKGGV
jgi:phosphoserine aminotransferase